MSDSDPEDTRESGVEFGELKGKLESHDYPASTEKLVEAYGVYELELQDGVRTFAEVLKPGEMDHDETFESAEEVQQAVYNMLGSEAIGRKGYSDRGSHGTRDREESF
ncbi:MAG: DUF5789 family protein [Halobacteriota archaeon]